MNVDCDLSLDMVITVKKDGKKKKTFDANSIELRKKGRKSRIVELRVIGTGGRCKFTLDVRYLKDIDIGDSEVEVMFYPKKSNDEQYVYFEVRNSLFSKRKESEGMKILEKFFKGVESVIDPSLLPHIIGEIPVKSKKRKPERESDEYEPPKKKLKIDSPKVQTTLTLAPDNISYQKNAFEGKGRMTCGDYEPRRSRRLAGKDAVKYDSTYFGPDKYALEPNEFMSGIRNLGNTCYISAILNCLRHLKTTFIEDIRRFAQFLDESFFSSNPIIRRKPEPNTTNTNQIVRQPPPEGFDVPLFFRAFVECLLQDKDTPSKIPKKRKKKEKEKKKRRKAVIRIITKKNGKKSGKNTTESASSSLSSEPNILPPPIPVSSSSIDTLPPPLPIIRERNHVKIESSSYQDISELEIENNSSTSNKEQKKDDSMIPEPIVLTPIRTKKKTHAIFSRNSVVGSPGRNGTAEELFPGNVSTSPKSPIFRPKTKIREEENRMIDEDADDDTRDEDLDDDREEKVLKIIRHRPQTPVRIRIKLKKKKTTKIDLTCDEDEDEETEEEEEEEDKELTAEEKKKKKLEDNHGEEEVIIDPSELKQLTGLQREIFSGGGQQDSHEFLLACFQIFKEDVERMKNMIIPFLRSLDYVIPNQLQQQPNIMNVRPPMNPELYYNNLFLPLERNFGGKMERKFTCRVCQKFSRVIDDFELLSCPLNSPKANLETVLHNYFSNYPVERRCNFCGTNGVSDVFVRILQLPRILIIHLKRFLPEYNQETGVFRQKKLHHVVGLQNTVNVRRFCSDNVTFSRSGRGGGSIMDPILFDINSFIIHEGRSTKKGHYVCFTKNEQEDWWYKINDDVSEKKIKERSVFCDRNQKKVYIIMMKLQ